MSPAPTEVNFAGGKVSSSENDMYLIPLRALGRIARRFRLGIERKGDRAWNAVSPNQEVLTNREFLLERIGHVLSHARNLQGKLLRGEPLDAGDDDPAALGWSAFLFCEATEALREDSMTNCSGCSGTGKVSFDKENTRTAVPQQCPVCRGSGKVRKKS